MKLLTNMDLGKNEIQNARIQNLAAAPENPVEGQMYHNTTDRTTYIYAGGTWTDALCIVKKSSTNGNVLIKGSETKVYTHPGSGTNPHGTTKGDIGLGNVENKSAAAILNELTAAKIAEKLGFAPREIKVGTDSSKGTATGSKIVYIATDTKKIWLDNASGAWLQVGGQDTISWGNVTGKPSTYTPPIASASTLGGIKVGANLSITADGTLSAEGTEIVTGASQPAGHVSGRVWIKTS